ncbi:MULTISPECIES: Gfo/Idh/MocA family protein [Asaia]|uniref:Galactose 1-dehydrogenase n=1 Tax=Asaia bogorensis TaxID=91915 RepID=A0A060QHS0_9PROT|nr:MULTISPECIES: Gfo/Idh/MocA family oxidoreductase [Asaia]MDL2170099.1 Gfo/Idh/MocA family oxidoreductase [Asaia sp. HumB]CDG38337.1 Galactose 1-dehydrogenase [Asaia bogorensis]
MIRIAVIGVGQIARQQHLPALATSSAYHLAAAVSPVPVTMEVPVFASIEALIESHIDIDAVAICTPPSMRYDLAMQALEAGWHVLLEKPPTLTRSQAQALLAVARQRGLTVFAAWHSIHAAAVPSVAAYLKENDPVRVEISWKENADKWHPGADWLWRPGALGVFDAGINALSILCAVSPEALVFEQASLDFFAQQQAPARARLALVGARTRCPVSASFDWRHERENEIWEIIWTMPDGAQLLMSEGGARLSLGGKVMPLAESREYDGVYDSFAALITAQDCALDLRPLDIVTESLAYGTRHHRADEFQ